MEGRKTGVFFTVYVMVLIMSFGENGAMAATEIVGAPAPAPAPGMESSGMALYVPAAMAAIISLATMLFWT